jgi:hypothetical protein
MKGPIEPIIISNLIFDEQYTRKVIPFLKAEYFQDASQKLAFTLIDAFLQKYNTLPTKEALLIDLSNTTGIDESTERNTKALLKGVEKQEVVNEWLLNSTEKFCQDRAIYNALMQSIKIWDDKSGKTTTGAIPKILQDALAVSFDTHIGHDFVDDYEARYEYYHRKEYKIPFDLDMLNLITAGGFSRKTLNILSAGTGGGKSLGMCHFSAANLLAGYNVLYITLEMSEEEIAKRIDANVLDIPLPDLVTIPWDTYDMKINKLKNKALGKIIIKEYPTASAGSANFRFLMNELNLKKNFKPDILYVDYLNICSSSRYRNMQVRPDLYVKSVAEELRGLAIEFNIPVVTGTQYNRGGFGNSDPGLGDSTADAFSVTWTADFMGGFISSEELDRLGQITFKQMGKNRYSDPTKNVRFVLGIDRIHMRLYNVEASAQQDFLSDDEPKTISERAIATRAKQKFDRSIFNDFK